MTNSSFWSLIDSSRAASGGNPYVQAEVLVGKLSVLPEKEILEFNSIFQKLMELSYLGSLCDIAYIIGCGCGDDGFEDFRAWLIAQGKDVYETVINDPEKLLDIVDVGQETQITDLLFAVSNAYRIKTNGMKSLPPSALPQLIGECYEDNLKLARFPKFTAKFWARCDDEIR